MNQTLIERAERFVLVVALLLGAWAIYMMSQAVAGDRYHSLDIAKALRETGPSSKVVTTWPSMIVEWSLETVRKPDEPTSVFITRAISDYRVATSIVPPEKAESAK